MVEEGAPETLNVDDEDDEDDEANVDDDEPEHNARVVVQPTNRHPGNLS